MAITIDELPAALQGIADKIKEEMRSRILFAAGLAMEAEMKDRIFGQGKDSEGNSIGNYSVKSAWFSREQFVRQGAFKPNSKSGGEVKVFNVKTKRKKIVNVTKDFRETQSMWLKNGYKEFRDIQGRQTAFVDNKLSGDLEKSIQTVKINEDTVYIAITDKIGSDKRKGNEKHFGKSIYSASKTDKEVFIKAVNDEVQHLRNTGLIS